MIRSLLLSTALSISLGTPLMAKPHNYLSYFPNQVVNGDFTNGSNGWLNSTNTSTEIVTYTDKVNLYSQNGTNVYIYQTNRLTVNDKYYLSFNMNLISGSITMEGFSFTPITTFGNFNYSYVLTANGIHFLFKRYNPVLTNIDLDNIILINVSQMIANGVKDDNGTLFSDLTNGDIKSQLDKWILNEPRDRTSVNLFTTFNDLIKHFIPDDLEATYGEAIFYFTYGLIALFVGTTMYITYKTIRRIIGFGG